MTLAHVFLIWIALLAGGPVKVSCEPCPQGWMIACAWKDQHRIRFAPELCAAANEFERTGVIPAVYAYMPMVDDPVVALETFGHEAAHVREPHATERMVQCDGLRDLSTWANVLGHPELKQDLLIRALYWLSPQPSLRQCEPRPAVFPVPPGLVERKEVRR